MNRAQQPQAQFALRRGREQLPLTSLLANGKPVASGHELTHVVQQRECELTLTFAQPSASAGTKTIIGGFKSLSGMDSETEVIDLARPGLGVTLKDFRIDAGGAQRWYSPGLTKYSTVKLSRGS
jgi:hypothetical protein